MDTAEHTIGYKFCPSAIRAWVELSEIVTCPVFVWIEEKSCSANTVTRSDTGISKNAALSLEHSEMVHTRNAATAESSACGSGGCWL